LAGEELTMPKTGLTEVVLIVDRSGSMLGIAHEMTAGIKSFVEGQRAGPGEARFTLVQFDDVVQVVLEDQPVDGPWAYTLIPRHNTALNDAVCTTIDRVGARLEARAEADRPEKVIVLVVTDGYENASREFTKADVRHKVTLQQNTYGWVFHFLGANIDAFAEGGARGFVQGQSLNYAPSAAGVGAMFSAASASTLRSRSNEDASYTDEERVRAAGGPTPPTS
jgi:uncharacterized protein YegL